MKGQKLLAFTSLAVETDGQLSWSTEAWSSEANSLLWFGGKGYSRLSLSNRWPPACPWVTYLTTYLPGQAYFWYARSQAGSRLQAPGYSVHMFQACTSDANDTASLNYSDPFRDFQYIEGWPMWN